MADVLFGTSGSTGASKPIVRTEASLSADAAALVAAFPDVWGRRPAVVATIRPEHMYGALWRVRAPAAAGSVVDPAVVLSVEELLAAKVRHGSFLLVTTPSFLDKALLHPDFSALRGAVSDVVTSGSLLRAETSAAVTDALGVSPLEIYGSTEAGTVAWRRQASTSEWTLVDGVSAQVVEGGALQVDSPYAVARPWTMGDGVRFVTPRRFELLGRLDRRVKILESYVSLPDVERALESHPFVSRAVVATCGEDVARLGAVVVLSAEGRAFLAQSTYAETCRRLREDLCVRCNSGQTLFASNGGRAAFPRRIRFVRELPFNSQGKVTAAAVRAVLADRFSEPVVTAWRVAADALEATLVFPSDATCFQGHFPGCPILPGVAQLHALRRFAQQAFPDYPDAAIFRKLKFRRIVRPGEALTLSVVRTDGGFSFVLSSVGGVCSSGVAERTAP